MAFIKESVGTQGKNNQADVVIIVELIIMAHINNAFLSRTTIDRLSGEGTFFYLFANDALREFFSFVANYNQIFKLSINFPPSSATIYPDDLYYRLLLACVVCGGRRPLLADYEKNPLLNQAMTGRISYDTFKSVVSQAKCATLTATGLKAREALKDARVRAFLDMLAFAEGNTDYRTGFDYQYIDDLSKHPGTASGGSSAAGRYQFLSKDWKTAKDKLGLFDFTPESQDIAAVYLLQTRPFEKKGPYIIDAILSDDFNQAIQLGSYVWASLPHDFNDGKTNPDTNPTSYHLFKGKRQKAKGRTVLWDEYGRALAGYRR